VGKLVLRLYIIKCKVVGAWRILLCKTIGHDFAKVDVTHPSKEHFIYICRRCNERLEL
jgi:hypothetical protein